MTDMEKWIQKINKLQTDCYAGNRKIRKNDLAFAKCLVLAVFIIFFIPQGGKYTILGICIGTGLASYIATRQTSMWCRSLGKGMMLLMAIFLCYVFTVSLILICAENIYIAILFITYVTICFVKTWYWISVITQSVIAKIENELISAICTIMFTVGTYVVGLLFNDVPSMNAFQKTYGDISQLKNVIANNGTLYQQFFMVCCKMFLEVAFLMILPTLCVSLFAIAAIDLKDFYMKKYEMEEFWTRMERERKEHRKQEDTEKETIE